MSIQLDGDGYNIANAVNLETPGNRLDIPRYEKVMRLVRDGGCDTEISEEKCSDCANLSVSLCVQIENIRSRNK